MLPHREQLLGEVHARLDTKLVRCDAEHRLECIPSIVVVLAAIAAPSLAQGLIQVNRQALVSRADLVYKHPATRPEEGPGAIDAEHIAGLSAGIHQTLLDSRPESVTDSEPISLFNRWPKDWDATFTLLARGGFLISSAQVKGTIPLVEIVSQLGGECRLANPWTGPVTLYRNGRRAEGLSGQTLVLGTAKGETIVVVPSGSTPGPVKMPSS